MKLHFAVPLLSLAALGICQGAGFSTNFNSGYDNSLNVAGQNGWVIDDATEDLSFFVNYNLTNAAALGGFYDAPVGTGARLSHGLSLPLIQSSLGLDFAIVPSTVDFPGRDTFGWSLYNSTGTNLLTIQFEPDSINPQLMNVTWSTGAGGSATTGLGVEYNGPYRLNVDFSGAGADAEFTATVTGANAVSFSGTLSGFGGETLASVGQTFVRNGATVGDNYMLFDNISAVPEPSTGIMFLTALAVPLMRRRRKVF